MKTILPSINKNTDDEMPLVETKNEGDRGRKRLKMASILCLFFVICEFTAGIIAKSTAVQADAAHLLTDLFSFLISLAALHLGMFFLSFLYKFSWIALGGEFFVISNLGY